MTKIGFNEYNLQSTKLTIFSYIRKKKRVEIYFYKKKINK